MKTFHILIECLYFLKGKAKHAISFCTGWAKSLPFSNNVATQKSLSWYPERTTSRVGLFFLVKGVWSHNGVPVGGWKCNRNTPNPAALSQPWVVLVSAEVECYSNSTQLYPVLRLTFQWTGTWQSRCHTICCRTSMSQVNRIRSVFLRHAVLFSPPATNALRVPCSVMFTGSKF